VTFEEQVRRARLLRSLHQGGRVLVLPNAWDVISARVFEDAGFPAVGTTSFGIARAHGLRDGENSAGECSLAMVRRMAATLSIPLTADIEAGYSATDSGVEPIGRAFVEAGAVGFNIEDGRPDPAAPLAEVARQCERIAALRRAGAAAGVPVFVNARTDVFWLRVGPAEVRLKTALRRAEAYLAAGADGVFIPGLDDPDRIREAAGAIPAPLNVLAGPATPPVPVLEALGVTRLSVGSGPVRATLGLLRAIAAELRGAGTYRYLEGALPYDVANAL
jgi:2-methylisocitrate lyase-like PEP mutase family enzyme